MIVLDFSKGRIHVNWLQSHVNFFSMERLFSRYFHLRNSFIFSRSFPAKLPGSTRNKARKLRVTSFTGCRLIHLQFAGEISSGVATVLLAIVGILLAIVSIFAVNCRYFWLQLLVFVLSKCLCFCFQKRAILNAYCGRVCCKFSVIYPLYSCKFKCDCNQFACNAGWSACCVKVNLAVFTGKWLLTPVNGM